MSIGLVRIGFDVSQTGRLKAGCGYFADTLLQHLVEREDDQYILYPTFGAGVWDPEWATTTRQWPDRLNVQRGLGHETMQELESFWRTPPHNLEVLLGSPDVVHANNFYCPTALSRAQLVYTLYDLGFLVHPEWTTEANRTVCFEGIFNAALYADHLIAISHSTRRHFLETFPHYPSDRVSVVYPASRFEAAAEVPKPASLAGLSSDAFWLSVGTLEPRKNHLRLLEAYARLRAQNADTGPLVLVGGRGWLMDELAPRLEQLGLTGHVTYLGYVDDATLAWLYQHCFAFCYLSSFEGFGLPVVEAMSLGAAVLTSNLTSLPEIVGSAGVMVDPGDTDQIVQEMRRMSEVGGQRESLRERARIRAAEFTWPAAATRVRDIYARVLDERSAGSGAPATRAGAMTRSETSSAADD